MKLDTSNLNVERLTTRQSECARFVAKGWSSKEIARHLDISPSTVDNHISSAMTILGITRRSEFKNYFPDDSSAEKVQNEVGFIQIDSQPSDEFNRALIVKNSVNEGKIWEDHVKKLYVYTFLFVTSLLLIIWALALLTLRLIKALV